jgi:hypothetical protein
MTEVTMNMITSTIKSARNIDKTFKVNTGNNRYHQPYSIPENVVSQEDRDCAIDTGVIPIQQTNMIHYIENELLEIPAYFDTFLDLNQYYIYGCKSFLDSLMLILDVDFKIMNVDNKQAEINKLNNLLVDNLNTCYKDYGYNALGIKKTEIKQSIADKSFNHIILKYICDFLNINVLVINIENKIYIEHKCFNIDDTKNNIILLQYQEHVLPLVHMYGENFTYKDLQKIKLNFKQLKTIEKISAYSQVELVALAEENKISIYNNNNSNNNNNKKKLKAELYADIKFAFEN